MKWETCKEMALRFRVTPEAVRTWASRCLIRVRKTKRPYLYSGKRPQFRHPSAGLTNEEVAKIRVLKGKATTLFTAKLFAIDHATVWRIWKGVLYKE